MKNWQRVGNVYQKVVPQIILGVWSSDQMFRWKDIFQIHIFSDNVHTAGASTTSYHFYEEKKLEHLFET